MLGASPTGVSPPGVRRRSPSPPACAAHLDVPASETACSKAVCSEPADAKRTARAALVPGELPRRLERAEAANASLREQLQKANLQLQQLRRAHAQSAISHCAWRLALKAEDRMDSALSEQMGLVTPERTVSGQVVVATPGSVGVGVVTPERCGSGQMGVATPASVGMGSAGGVVTPERRGSGQIPERKGSGQIGVATPASVGVGVVTPERRGSGQAVTPERWGSMRSGSPTAAVVASDPDGPCPALALDPMCDDAASPEPSPKRSSEGTLQTEGSLRLPRRSTMSSRHGSAGRLDAMVQRQRARSSGPGRRSHAASKGPQQLMPQQQLRTPQQAAIRARPVGESLNSAADSFVTDAEFRLSCMDAATRPPRIRGDRPHQCDHASVPQELCDESGRRWWRSSRLLGKGASGEVWMGMSQEGALCALKGVRPSGGSCDEELMGEVRLLLTFRHPNVIEHLGTALFNGGHCVLITEYVPGGSLDGLLSLFRRLPEPSVRRYTKDITKGLAYLHGEHITHGDLKPGNVLLQINGRCKLCDFGAAAMLAARSQYAAATAAANAAAAVSAGALLRSPRMRSAAKAVQMGLRLQHLSGGSVPRDLLLVGTPAYMAPEACVRTARQPADVWSLGVSLCHLLSGQIPYDVQSADAHSLVWKLGRGDITPKVPAEVLATPDCAEFVMRCLRVDPATRPSPRELALHDFVQVGTPPSESLPPPSPRPAASPSPRLTFSPPPRRQKTPPLSPVIRVEDADGGAVWES
eukprot:TRINITY_DN10841_c0_g1_i1.p1 TRINITY_DN10841_c0_g1~~TRINITY_DN10841_c0_g1_i1.p1  ORF type:complete len:756 (+),score=202.61 TRINITY_DN10841_c0_g1_i1:47-2314(+)